jgi:hypothetical protein
LYRTGRRKQAAVRVLQHQETPEFLDGSAERRDELAGVASVLPADG